MERSIVRKMFLATGAAAALGLAGTSQAQTILGDAYSYTGAGQGLIEDFNGGLLDLSVGHLDPTATSAGYDDTVVAGTTTSGTKWSVRTKDGEFATSLRNPYVNPYGGNSWAFTERGYAGGGDAQLIAEGSHTGTAADYPSGTEYNLSVFGGSRGNNAGTGNNVEMTARFTNNTGGDLDALTLYFDVEVSHLRGDWASQKTYLGLVNLAVSTDNATWTNIASFGEAGDGVDSSLGLISGDDIDAAIAAIGSGTGRGWYTDAEMDANGLSKRGLGGTYDVSALGIDDGTDFYVRWGVPQNSGQQRVQFGIDNLTTIPEPGSIALLGLGGLALIARRRRAA